MDSEFKTHNNRSIRSQQDTAAHTNIVSILDVDLSASINVSYKEIINSPRTLEAMANLGIMPEELDDVSYEHIK